MRTLHACLGWHHGAFPVRFLIAVAVIALNLSQAVTQGIASEVVVPVVRDMASEFLPVSKASFEELRIVNAGLKASNANIRRANSQSTAVLEAVKAKLKDLVPGSPGTDGINASNGPRGPTGFLGQESVTGGTGLSGRSGGTGQAGFVGDTGTRGSRGASGHSGFGGDTGASGLLGSLGTTGIEGSLAQSGGSGQSGLLGKTGYSGSAGATGITNLQGTQGGEGLSGVTSNTGVTGNTGATTRSNTGRAGRLGASGLSGASGKTGNTGFGCIAPYVTLNFDDIPISAANYESERASYTYRGVTFSVLPSTPTPFSINIINQAYYGNLGYPAYGVQSRPNFFEAQNDVVTGAIPMSGGIAFQDSSGAAFGLQSLYLDGSVQSGCSETLTISGTTANGAPNPACSAVLTFPVGGRAPVRLDFNPPCFATTISVVAVLNNPGCYGGNSAILLTLDDITMCRTSPANNIP